MTGRAVVTSVRIYGTGPKGHAKVWVCRRLVAEFRVDEDQILDVPVDPPAELRHGSVVARTRNAAVHPTIEVPRKPKKPPKPKPYVPTCIARVWDSTAWAWPRVCGRKASGVSDRAVDRGGEPYPDAPMCGTHLRMARPIAVRPPERE